MNTPHEIYAPDVCEWHEIDNLNMPDTWEAECGAVWTFNEGGPKDNEVNFCPKCGKSVLEIAPVIQDKLP